MIDRAFPDSGTKKCNVPCPHAGVPGIPDKNVYQFQGKGGVGRGLGKSGSGKKELVSALPVTAVLLIFLMFMVLFIMVSPLISPSSGNLAGQLSQNAITCFVTVLAVKLLFAGKRINNRRRFGKTRQRTDESGARISRQPRSHPDLRRLRRG